MATPRLERFVQRLLTAPEKADVAAVRLLAREEIARRRDGLDGCGDALVGMCFLLYLVGEAEDVLLIDDAKHANFDAGATIDLDFYRMRRTRSAMRAVVRGRPRAVELVELAFDSPNYESPAHFEAQLRFYFRMR